MASGGRMPLVGVIGGEDRSGCARLVGRELTKHGCVVLTGGCAIDDCSTTKNAAIMGTLDAERYGEGLSRYIGILPHGKSDKLSFEQISERQILIHSSLGSMNRDPLNGITPDVLVCFAGGPGTICELAFGIMIGREAVFHDNSAEILLDTCTGRNRKQIERDLLQVVKHWKSHPQFSTDRSKNIMDSVTKYLREAVSRRKLTSAQEIVCAALELLPKQLPNIPMFLGIPGDCIKKQIDEFASYWSILSKNSE